MKRNPGCITALKIAAAGMALVLVGPFLVPVPPLQDTVPAQALADADSQFAEINGIRVHYKIVGTGEPVFVLMHGFASSLYSWREVMVPFSQIGTVIAYDRPAFGLTERPVTWEGENPYGPAAQVDLLFALLDHFGIQRAILVGNSAGGTLAMQAAIVAPQRVEKLILVDPAVYASGGAAGWLRPLLATPQLRHLGPLIARQMRARGENLIDLAWHEPGMVTAEIRENYRKPYSIENWDRAIWEFTLASRPSGLIDRLDALTLPVLVVTGDDDRIVPTADSIRLAGELPDARLSVISSAGHIPHEEQPQLFMQAVTNFLGK